MYRLDTTYPWTRTREGLWGRAGSVRMRVKIVCSPIRVRISPLFMHYTSEPASLLRLLRARAVPPSSLMKQQDQTNHIRLPKHRRKSLQCVLSRSPYTEDYDVCDSAPFSSRHCSSL